MGLPEIDVQKKYSLEEYFKLEESSEQKYEFHDGTLVGMAGGTGEHSSIINRIGTALNNELDKGEKDCTVYTSDLKVKIASNNKRLYPDLSLTCGEAIYEDDRRTVLTNPILLIEVLSLSTKEYDKAGKFELYRSIPSFQEYMIVYQTVPKVQTWFKEAKDLWRIGNAEGMDSTITLHSIDCTIALKDIYRRIKNLRSLDQDLDRMY